MTVRNRINRTDIAPVELSAELSTALGKSVGVQIAHPSTGDELIIVDTPTGDWLDVDPTKVAAVVASHVPPAPVPTPVKALSDALAGANTLPAAIAAVKGYADALVAQEGRARQRPRGPAARP